MANRSAKTLDIDYVRSCFPAFEEPLGRETAFFENAGGSYVAGPVLDRLVHFYRANKVQPYGACEILRAAGQQMDQGRQTMADLLGVPSHCITLGASTTQNFNTLALACSSFVTADSEIIVTEQDHEANIGAWQRLSERTGATLKLWPVDADSAELDLATFENLLTPATALVCVTHSSNIVGSINPVEQIIALCRGNGSRVVVDGVSFAPHSWPDLPQLQPDAYSFSSYKTYATHLGIMYTSQEFVETLDPQCHYFNRANTAKWLDSSGPDHASIAALAGLGEYFANSYKHHYRATDDQPVSLYEQAQSVSALMHQHETDLCQQLLNEIADLPIRIIGRNHMHGREANIALISLKHRSATLSEQLASKAIAAGHGDFYARRLLEKIGIENTDDGVLRISFAHYNSQDDVRRIAEALRALH